MEINSINRIIYGQTDAKTGLNEIFIGEIKGTVIGRSRSVLTKEIGKQQLYWTGMWNDSGTKAFIRIPLPTPFIAGLGVIGLIMGVVSFVKNKDRSPLTLLSISIGLLIVFWIAAEIAFPH